MKLTTEDIVKEALAVRDEGQEPAQPAEVYEQALLAVAHREQGPSEDFPAALARVVRTDLTCDALIFAADRRRDAEAAAATGGKPVPSSAIATDAARVAKSGGTPAHTKDGYHEEMMRLSKAEERSGETPVISFARLAAEGRFDDLYAAGELADEHERATAMTKAAPDDRFHRLLVSMAQMSKRAGESIDQACARLLDEDPVCRAAYDSTQQGR